MKNENKKQSENINNSNEELLLSDVSISNSKQCVNHMAIGRDFTDEFGRSDIHQTGFTRRIDAIESVNIELAYKLYNSF